MPAVLIDGRKIACELLGEVAVAVRKLKAAGITPGLAVILADGHAAGQAYTRTLQKRGAETGTNVFPVCLSKDASQSELEDRIDQLNADPAVHGILVQLPLPPCFQEAAALERIHPSKDVDGFHVINAGLLFTGRKGTVPCTPGGILHLLKASNVPLAGREAVVVGRSNVVGKPVAMLLLAENCTVTICHSQTIDLSQYTKKADILISCVGKPGLITEGMVKAGAAVIDVGTSCINGRMVGDVDFEAVQSVAGWITPVPGGVGPMTAAMLMRNTWENACKSLR